MNIFKPPMAKTYQDAKKIKLPKDFSYGMSVEEAILKRRSKREFIQKPLSLKELSSLLYYAGGETKGDFRAAPSAGALYPIEIYPVIHNVEGLEPGIYHYIVKEHSLALLKKGDYRNRISEACLGQEWVRDCNVVFISTAVFGRTTWKYGNRGHRYILLEAGHISENIYLVATSLGLGACAIGAYFDDDINNELNIDGKKEGVVYITVVGTLKKKEERQ